MGESITVANPDPATLLKPVLLPDPPTASSIKKPKKNWILTFGVLCTIALALIETTVSDKLFLPCLRHLVQHLGWYYCYPNSWHLEKGQTLFPLNLNFLGMDSKEMQNFVSKYIPDYGVCDKLCVDALPSAFHNRSLLSYSYGKKWLQWINSSKLIVRKLISQDEECSACLLLLLL